MIEEREQDQIVPDEPIMDPETGKRKWRIGDIGRILAASVAAIFKGQLIFKLKIDKYFLQIAWTFLLFAMTILFSLGVDSALSKVEKNKKTLKELEILHTQKKYELITLNRRSTVSSLLEEKGSAVKEPEKPAITIE